MGTLRTSFLAHVGLTPRQEMRFELNQSRPFWPARTGNLCQFREQSDRTLLSWGDQRFHVISRSLCLEPHWLQCGTTLAGVNRRSPNTNEAFTELMSSQAIGS